LNTGSAGIAEVFSSIQGEGPFVGFRQIFIRFFPCNLLCSYCDTPGKNADHDLCCIEKTPGKKDFFSMPDRVSVDHLLEIVDGLDLFSGLHHSISLTGGEPLLQADFLENWLPPAKKKFRIYLETNGSLTDQLLKVIDHIDIISMDIKLPETAGIQSLWEAHSSFLEISSAKDVFVKVVVSGRTPDNEFAGAINLVAQIDNKIPFVIQPVTGVTKSEEISSDRLIDLQRKASLSLTNVRVIPQTHKILGIL